MPSYIHQMQDKQGRSSTVRAVPQLQRGDCRSPQLAKRWRHFQEVSDGVRCAVEKGSTKPGLIVTLCPSKFGEFCISMFHRDSKIRKHSIWLKLPIANVNLVEAAVAAGFGYHHAEPTYLMLTLWLPDGPCSLPPNASHQVGVGAFVLNDENDVSMLLIDLEKYDTSRTRVVHD